MRGIFSLIILVWSLLFNIAWGQNNSVVINENFQDVPLIEVLDILQEKYHLKVAFDQQTVQGIYVNQKINDLPLQETLQLLFQNQTLDFQIFENNQIFLRRSLSDHPEIPALTSCQGQILDALTGAPLAFATVVYALGKGTTTDENGRFAFETDESVATLSVQYLGYEQVDVSLQSLPPSDLKIRLTPKPTEIQSVTIIEREPLVSNQRDDFYGSLKLNARQLSTLPSFVGGKDLLRSVQLLPGVSAHDDLSSQIKVRGSNGEENMVVLDGIHLYNVGHFFGIFSIINPSIVDEVKLYKNVFPIEFGGRTASVVDITSLPLENKNVRGSAEVNLLTSNAYLELPIGSKMGIMLGGRITNKNVANTRLFAPLDQNTRTPRNETDAQNELLFALEPDFSFYDANAKWKWEATKNTLVTASFFSGKDKFNYDLSRQFINRFQTNDEAIFSERANWKNMGGSLQLEQTWSDQLSSQFTLSRSNFVNETATTSIVNRFSSIIEGREQIEINNSAYNEILGWNMTSKNVWTPNERETFTLGAEWSQQNAQSTIQVDDTTVLATDERTSQIAFFAEYHTKIKDKLKLTFGLRPTYFDVTNKIYFSPRLYLSYPTGSSSQLKASWSQYYQFLRQTYHENRLGRTFDIWVIADGERFPVSNSQQFMFGWNFAKNGFEIDLELYHKKLKGTIEHALIYNGAEEINGMRTPNFQYRLFQGDGRSYGLDLLLKKDVGNYSGWLAYTLSKTTHSFPQIANGVYFPSPEDRRHQLKWINQYRIKRWDFSLSYIFTSGAPFTDISRLATQTRDRRLIDPNDRISYLENYHRVDVGVTYRFPLFNSSGELGFSIFNLFDQKNIKYRQYNYAFPLQTPPVNPNLKLIGTEVQMLGITPNLSIKINFGALRTSELNSAVRY